jgi:hypothetical protein
MFVKIPILEIFQNNFQVLETLKHNIYFRKKFGISGKCFQNIRDWKLISRVSKAFPNLLNSKMFPFKKTWTWNYFGKAGNRFHFLKLWKQFPGFPKMENFQNTFQQMENVKMLENEWKIDKKS